jgi:hypothetical protein
MKRRRLIVSVLVLTILSVSFWLALRPHPLEPTYNGRGISAWLDDYSKVERTQNDKRTYERRRQALAALQEIGPNGVPFILQRVDSDTSDWRKGYLAFWRKSPGWLQSVLPNPRLPLDLDGAATLFDLIGTNTVPQLVEAFNDPKVLVRKTALFSVGLFVESKGVKAPENAIPGLIQALDDPDEAMRTMSAILIGHMAPASSNAIPSLIKALDKPGTNLLLLVTTADALGKFGSAASNASPKLKVLLNNPNFDIRTEAAVVLWQIDADATTVLPVFLAMLPRLDGVMRWRIIEALGQMGPAASNAFPLLVDELNKMTSASPVDRKKITDAMFKIDPEAAAMELR